MGGSGQHRVCLPPTFLKASWRAGYDSGSEYGRKGGTKY